MPNAYMDAMQRIPQAICHVMTPWDEWLVTWAPLIGIAFVIAIALALIAHRLKP